MYIGIRFEDKQRKINEICEYSKHNTDRDDERDFPEFNSEEYKNMYTFNGTSSWDLSQNEAYKTNDYNANIDCTKNFLQKHCYIIAGNTITNIDDGLDDNEIVIKNAIVIVQMF